MTPAWIKDRFRRIAANPTLRGVAMIGSGSAIGQAVQVAATPVVSRLYGPHAYGALAVFSGVLSVAAILVTLRYEVTIPLPREDAEARDILLLAFLLAGCAAALTGLGLGAWQLIAPHHHTEPLLRHMVWTLPLGMVGIAGYQSLSYWATRTRRYGTISATRMNQAIAAVGAQVALPRLPPAGLGLILAYITGQAFGLRPLFLSFWRSRPHAPLPSPRRLWEVARKYGHLSAYGSATAVATAFGDSLPPLLLAKVYGLPVAGIYLMASRVFALPAQMVGAAMAQVFMGETSQRLRDAPASVPAYFRSVHRHLLWAGAGILALGAVSPLILPWVLGAKWEAAGIAAAVLAPMAAADITVRPLFNITVIANRPRMQLVSGLLPMGMALAGLGVPVLLKLPGTAALAGYSLCRCLGSWLIFLIYRRIVLQLAQAPPAPVPAAPSTVLEDA